MAVSLEARVPFLDYRLVELAATIPSSRSSASTKLKVILKKLAEQYIPTRLHLPAEAGVRGCRSTPGCAGALREPRRRPAHAQARSATTASSTSTTSSGSSASSTRRNRELTIELYHVFLLETWLQLFVDRRRRGHERPAAHRRLGLSDADRARRAHERPLDRALCPLPPSRATPCGCFSFSSDPLEGVDVDSSERASSSRGAVLALPRARARRCGEACGASRPTSCSRTYLSSNGLVAALARRRGRRSWSSARGGDVLRQAGYLPGRAPPASAR